MSSTTWPNLSTAVKSHHPFEEPDIEQSPPLYSELDPESEKNFDHYLNLYLNKEDVSIVRKLSKFHIIVFIMDDIDMNFQVSNTETGWDEMLKIMIPVINISGSLYPNGITVHFLNRLCTSNSRFLEGIKSFHQIQNLFVAKPSGPSIMCNRLKEIFDQCPTDQQSVVILAMSSIPSDGGASVTEFNKAYTKFRNILETRGGSTSQEIKDRVQSIFISILICTDDNGIAKYFRWLDQKLKNVDVTDDLKTTRAAIEKQYKKQHRWQIFSKEKNAKQASELFNLKKLYAKVLCPFSKELDNLDG